MERSCRRAGDRIQCARDGALFAAVVVVGPRMWLLCRQKRRAQHLKAHSRESGASAPSLHNNNTSAPSSRYVNTSHVLTTTLAP